MERRNPGLLLAGTYRDGVSLAEAIGSGERAATRVAELLGVEPVTAGSKRPARTASPRGRIEPTRLWASDRHPGSPLAGLASGWSSGPASRVRLRIRAHRDQDD